MTLKVFFIIFIFSQISLANSDSFSEKFKNLYFPKNLALLTVGISSREDVRKALGPPLKTENNKNLLFYDLAGHRFDTTIELANEKIKSLYFSLPQGTVKLDDIRASIPETIVNEFKYSKLTSHLNEELGESGQIRISSEKILLTVLRNKNEPIVSYYQTQ